MTNPLVTLRYQFASDLEEILQCPVCYETLSKTIPTCIQGHHVCLKCQEQMSNCPFCKGHFNGTRNYLAETLLSKFEEIKSSLLSPKQTFQQQVEKVCSETQTDFSGLEDEVLCGMIIKTDMNQNVKKNFMNPRITPAAGKGMFPCKLGNCSVELPHCRMLSHIRYGHKNNLIEEKAVHAGKYILDWEHDSSIKNYERFISIPNMGLFYLHVTINDTGDLQGNVQIIHNALTAKQFKYSLILSNQNINISYNGYVMSCRTTPVKIKIKSLIVNSLCMSQLMGKKKTVSCTLLLKRNVSDLALLIDQQKK